MGEYSINSVKKLMREFHYLSLEILNLRLKSLNLERSTYEFIAINLVCIACTLFSDIFIWFFLSASICWFLAEVYRFVIYKRINKMLNKWYELDAMLFMGLSRLEHGEKTTMALTEERERHVRVILEHFDGYRSK